LLSGPCFFHRPGSSGLSREGACVPAQNTELKVTLARHHTEPLPLLPRSSWLARGNAAAAKSQLLSSQYGPPAYLLPCVLTSQYGPPAYLLPCVLTSQYGPPAYLLPCVLPALCSAISPDLACLLQGAFPSLHPQEALCPLLSGRTSSTCFLK
jgi:hypothetical protein